MTTDCDNLSISNQSISMMSDAEALMNDVIGIWITGCICLLGVAGNVVSFIVLKRAFGVQSPMFHVLRAMSVSDSVFLLAVFTVQSAVNAYQYFGLHHVIENYRGYVQYGVWPLLMTTQMTTVWLTVLVSGERYVAICRPLHAATVCTASRVRLAVLSIILVSILFNVPRYFEVQVDDTGSVIRKSAIGNAPAFRILYTSVLYAMALFVVPLVLLVYLNVRLVMALRRGRSEWLHLQTTQRREQTLTAIPLTIVLVFFICGTPSLIVNVIDSVDPDLPTRYSSYVTLMVVANFLVVINSASNIIIYCLVGSQFRNKLIETLTGFARSCRQCVLCRDASPTTTPVNVRRARGSSNTTSFNLAVISAGCDATDSIIPLPSQ